MCLRSDCFLFDVEKEEDMPIEIKHSGELISARTNPFLIRMCKLEEKKHRENERLFRFDGIKLLLEAIDFGAEIEYVLVRDDSYERVIGLVNEHLGDRKAVIDGTLVRLGESAFEKLSNERSPEGVITVAKYIDKIHKICKIEKDSVLSFEGKTLMLESVRDPGNLGTMFRTAAAFGIGRMILTADCADIYNPKTLRAAMGAVFKTEIIRVDNAADAAKAMRRGGHRVLATALERDAACLGELRLEMSDVFLIGNEGHGLTARAIEAADKTVFIPMADGTESLNAAVAASVCMWEMSKI